MFELIANDSFECENWWKAFVVFAVKKRRIVYYLRAHQGQLVSLFCSSSKTLRTLVKDCLTYTFIFTQILFSRSVNCFPNFFLSFFLLYFCSLIGLEHWSLTQVACFPVTFYWFVFHSKTWFKHPQTNSDKSNRTLGVRVGTCELDIYSKNNKKNYWSLDWVFRVFRTSHETKVIKIGIARLFKKSVKSEF